jgi:hypothetical protein
MAIPSSFRKIWTTHRYRPPRLVNTGHISSRGTAETALWPTCADVEHPRPVEQPACGFRGRVLQGLHYLVIQSPRRRMVNQSSSKTENTFPQNQRPVTCSNMPPVETTNPTVASHGE